MIILKNVSLRRKSDLTLLVDKLSFSLLPGSKTALIGDEGTGKSTLLKAIADPSLIESYMQVEGEIAAPGELIAYLPQELERPELNFASYLDSLGASVDYRLYYELLDKLGLKEDFPLSGRPMGTLSGGEKVKWQLLGLLLRHPTALLLDEPSNDLDLRSLAWLERFLQELTIPVLFISHDETLLERCAGQLVHLELRHRRSEPVHTVSGLSYKEYAQERLRRIGLQNQQARKERAEDKKRQERYRELFEKVAREQEAISRSDPHGGRLLKKKMKSVKSMGKRYEREREEMTKPVHIDEAIFVRFREDIDVPRKKVMLDFSLGELSAAGRTLSRDLRLTLIGPEKVCLVGDNGSGKTTLLRRIREELLEKKVPHGYMPQNYADMFQEDDTAVSFLSETGTKEENTRVRTYLGSLGYTSEEMDSKVRELSGGQKAKLYFARLQLEGAPLLLLDEPTRNFSPLSGPVIREALKAFKGAILAVSHDRKLLGEVADTVYELRTDGLQEV